MSDARIAGMILKLKTLLMLLAALAGPAYSQTDAQAKRFAPGIVSIGGLVTLSPAFTPDGNTIYFPRANCPQIWQCPQLLYRSDFKDGAWQTAELVPGLGDFRVDWPSVSPSGEKLIFSWTAPREAYDDLDIIENFDLYTLELGNSDARPSAIIGADINRPRAGRLKTLRAFHVQSAGTMTENGDLYFWDEREDGTGERDVFVARSDGKGGFQDTQVMPAPINSVGRDQFGWINPSGTVMLLSYPDRGGEGGDDIFISRRSGEIWSEPQPLGPLVNSPAYEGGARFTPDGKSLVFTSNRAFEGTPEGLLQVWTVPTAGLVESGILSHQDLLP